MDHPAGLEAVRMRRNPAHCVHRNRATDHLVMLAPGPVGPRLIKDDLFLEGDMGKFGGDLADLRGRDAGGLFDRLGAVLIAEVAFGHQLEHRARLAAIGQRVGACQSWFDVRQFARGQRAFVRIPDQRIVVVVSRNQAVVGVARRINHQPAGVCVAHEVVEVDLLGAEQFVD